MPNTYQGDRRYTGAAAAAAGGWDRQPANRAPVAQDSLRTLADETNGFAAVSSNDFASAFERIVSDNSAYYVLAYYPPSNRRDGKFHRIEVRTSRPDLKVRARRGYAAPKGNPQAQAAVMDNGGASPVVLQGAE